MEDQDDDTGEEIDESKVLKLEHKSKAIDYFNMKQNSGQDEPDIFDCTAYMRKVFNPSQF